MSGSTAGARPVRRARWLIVLVVVLAGIGLGAARAHAADDGARAEAIRQLGVVRLSIDRTLALIKEGQGDAALQEARTGYLSHFELVEIPLRVADPTLTSDAETKFAEIRGAIGDGAPVDEVRDAVVELRAFIDRAERRLTDAGLTAPAVVVGQSFLIIFREGLEAVLLITVLFGYLEAVKAAHLRRPVVWGMAAAAGATVFTFVVLRGVLAALPVGREVLEAVTALLAVAMLFYVSFWLITRLEQKRWLEFLRARVWKAVSIGSTTALMLVGFTAVYREGFETALFYQALVSFGDGLGRWILLGVGLGLVALTAVAWAIFRLGRRLPLRTFLSAAVVMLMATSVAFLGNAVRSLQEADVVSLHRWPNWPRAPIFLSQSLGYWPTRETLLAQAALAAVYLVGAGYLFVLRPRHHRASMAPGATADGSTVDRRITVDVEQGG